MFTEYEEMLLNMKPAPFQALHRGFVINCAGEDYFSSCIHPLYDRNQDMEEKISSCEEFLERLDIDPAFRIIFEKSYQRFDEELYRRGYEKAGQGLVKALDIKNLQEELFTFASFIQNGVFFEESLKDIWINDRVYLMEMRGEQKSLFIDSVSRVPLKAAYFTLVEQNVLLGQGLAMFSGDRMLIHSVVINKKYRRLSYGRRLLMSMLSFGLRSGARRAIADIDYRNANGLRLFEKVGFTDLYPYGYRMKRREKLQ